MSTYLRKADKPAETARMEQHYTATAVAKPGKSKGSTGWAANIMESRIRDMLFAHGIETVSDLYVRKAGKADLRVKDRHGNMLTIEVKHGGGSLAYAEVAGMAEFPSTAREYCLQGVDWVVYALKADTTLKRTKLAYEYRVSKAEDFMDMLAEYCHGPKSSGWDSAVKFNNATHTAINIQST